MERSDKILNSVLQYMEAMNASGVNSFDLFVEDMPFTIEKDHLTLEELNEGQVKPRLLSDKARKLEELRKLTANCQKCPLFYQRRNVVFGKGDARGYIMFIGGYPSEIDDFNDLLYKGEEGELLNKIIKAMKVDVADFFITTAVKCHPPGESLPNPKEVEACKPYLLDQIKIIEPSIIVTLGSLAYQALMGVEPKLFTKRAHWESYNGIPVLPTFDLSDILKNSEIKKDVWEDMKSVMRKYQSFFENKGPSHQAFG